MEGFLGLIIIIAICWLMSISKKGESQDLQKKGVKCPYCGSGNVNRTSSIAGVSHKQHHKQFKCNNCGAYF